MKRHLGLLQVILLGAVTLGLAAPGQAANFDIARIYIEYNESANDLGFHVFLDAEDWNTLKIVNPAGKTILEVAGKAAYGDLGLTELFTEGAEPSLDDFPLGELLALFPEGRYTFIGMTVDGVRLVSRATLTHNVPAGPSVSTDVDDDRVTIHWSPVTGPAEILPGKRVQIVGYQVIVETFQVTLPASSTRVTLPREFVRSLGPGEHLFEVLSIESGGNQTITESSFFLGEDDD